MEHFQKNMTLITDVFRKLRTPKNMVRSMPKKSRFRVSVKSNMVKAPKHCSHLKESPFTTFIDQWEVNCPTKEVSISDMQNLKTVS